MFGRRSSRCTAAQSGTGRCSTGTSGGGGIQQRLEPFVIEIIRQRPAKAGQPCPAQIAVHRAWLSRRLCATARWLSPCPNRRRRTSRIFRIDNLSPGIPDPLLLGKGIEPTFG